MKTERTRSKEAREEIEKGGKGGWIAGKANERKKARMRKE